MENQLMHHGIKGMRWGVRKSVYKSMNKQQRKAQRQKYKQTKGELQKLKQKDLIKKGEMFINNNHLLDMSIQQANQIVNREAARAAINASLQGASLSASGGTNPFMFGMM